MPSLTRLDSQFVVPRNIMPAPKVLAGLPKPLLFGLYGAVGGLLGSLVFGEPLYRVIEPPRAASRPEPEVAVAVSPEIPVALDSRNTFTVEIARSEFDDHVTVRFEQLPEGIAIAPVTIPRGQTKATATVAATRAAPVSTRPVLAAAEARIGSKTVSASTGTSLTVSDPTRPEADVFFVLDVTGSMDWAIRGVRDGIGRFAADMNKNRIDFRVGLVAFRDLTFDAEPMTVLTFGKDDSPFTSNADEFREKVGRLRADGGGDPPESSLEAVTEACSQPFRKSATKVLLLITDVPPKVGAQNTVEGAVQRTAGTVKGADIDSVHLVIDPRDLPIYAPLREAGLDKGKGEFFALRDVAHGAAGFDRLIDNFGQAVTAAAKAKNPEGTLRVGGAAPPPEVKSLQSSKDYAKGSGFRLATASAIWTGAVAGLVCLALVAGQHHYLRGTIPEKAGLARGFLGGAAAGLIGGAAGQVLYLLAPGDPAVSVLFLVVGWALLGGLAGIGLTLFIPNLKRIHGLAGGAVGGVLGSIGFLAASALDDLLGRLLGGALVGFCIGLMTAVVEAAFRRAWLEVRFGKRETITVNLGPEPVKIGGDSGACTVWARGAAPVALRFFVRDGAVICDDPVMKRESQATDGFVKEVGNVTVTVRTAATAAAPRPQAAATPKPQPSAPARPIPLDDEEDLLPMPLPSASPPPPPAPPKIAPAPLIPPKPPAPVARPTAKPPIPTAPPPVVPAAVPKTEPEPAPAVAKHPDACPDCGRVNPGKPKQRYCMVCDNTY
jgi:Mg-chelatase subunit ChlD